jgi:hypothetical protein
MSETDFFGAPKIKREIPPEIERRIDEVSEVAGFRNREPLKPIPKRRLGTNKQLHNFTMRLDVDDAEEFIRWCDRERLSYREAFGRLVAMIPK